MAKSGPVLVIDVDSSSLGACILELGEVPILSHVKRVPVGTGDVRDPGALVPLLKESLASLIPEYAKQFPTLKTVSIVVASPWFAATIKGLSSKAEKPVKVSASSIERMVRDFKEKNPAAANHSVLEAVPITVEVNGYRTRVLQPVYGKTLSVTFYESITDTALKSMVEDVVHTSLAGATLTWHTTPLTYAETLLWLSDEEHAVVVDVGGEITDIMVLSHQRIAFVGSIPIGSRTIARKTQGKSGSLSDALSRLAMFSRAELSQKEMQAVSASLTEASREWQAGYLAVLAEAGNTVPLSHRVFVVGERDELPWLAQVISGAESRGQRPVPVVVGHDFFVGSVSYGEEGLFDASLVLDALFFHIRGARSKNDISLEPVLYSVQ